MVTQGYQKTMYVSYPHRIPPKLRHDCAFNLQPRL